MIEKAPEITACDAMIVATVASDDQRIQRPAGSEQVERVLDRRGVGEQQRALSEVVERERRQHEARPGDAHRPAAEMAHVGVERFRAGDDEHDRTEREEAERAVRGEERDRVGGLSAVSTCGAWDA